MSTDSLSPAADLAGIDLAVALPPAALRDLVVTGRMRPIPKDMRIFDQGEPADRAHALLSGCVRISQAGSDGEEILIRFISDGQIFGCVPVCTDQLYPADATAIVDSVEISWDQAELLSLMRRHSEIAINMITVVGKRLSETQERLRELATQTVDRRVAQTLHRLLEQAGRATGCGIEIAFPLRRKDIADIAGTTLHSVSRILADWERQGLLSSRNQQLVLHSPEVIRWIAERGMG